MVLRRGSFGDGPVTLHLQEVSAEDMIPISDEEPTSHKGGKSETQPLQRSTCDEEIIPLEIRDDHAGIEFLELQLEDIPDMEDDCQPIDESQTLKSERAGEENADMRDHVSDVKGHYKQLEIDTTDLGYTPDVPSPRVHHSPEPVQSVDVAQAFDVDTKFTKVDHDKMAATVEDLEMTVKALERDMVERTMSYEESLLRTNEIVEIVSNVVIDATSQLRVTYPPNTTPLSGDENWSDEIVRKILEYRDRLGKVQTSLDGTDRTGAQIGKADTKTATKANKKAVKCRRPSADNIENVGMLQKKIKQTIERASEACTNLNQRFIVEEEIVPKGQDMDSKYELTIKLKPKGTSKSEIKKRPIPPESQEKSVMEAPKGPPERKRSANLELHERIQEAILESQSVLEDQEVVEDLYERSQTSELYSKAVDDLLKQTQKHITHADHYSFSQEKQYSHESSHQIMNEQLQSQVQNLTSIDQKVKLTKIQSVQRTTVIEHKHLQSLEMAPRETEKHVTFQEEALMYSPPAETNSFDGDFLGGQKLPTLVPLKNVFLPPKTHKQKIEETRIFASPDQFLASLARQSEDMDQSNNIFKVRKTSATRCEDLKSPTSGEGKSKSIKQLNRDVKACKSQFKTFRETPVEIDDSQISTKKSSFSNEANARKDKSSRKKDAKNKEVRPKDVNSKAIRPKDGNNEMKAAPKPKVHSSAALKMTAPPQPTLMSKNVMIQINSSKPLKFIKTGSLEDPRIHQIDNPSHASIQIHKQVSEDSNLGDISTETQLRLVVDDDQVINTRLLDDQGPQLEHLAMNRQGGTIRKTQQKKEDTDMLHDSEDSGSSIEALNNEKLYRSLRKFSDDLDSSKVLDVVDNYKFEESDEIGKKLTHLQEDLDDMDKKVLKVKCGVTMLRMENQTYDGLSDVS